jgi:hypothetical protein
MGQRPTPFTPKFINEIQLLIEFHPDGVTANFLFGTKNPAYGAWPGSAGLPETRNHRSGAYFTRMDDYVNPQRCG